MADNTAQDKNVETGTASEERDTGVIVPNRPVPRKYVLPILYLADRMASSDKNVAVKERSAIEDLAKAAGMEQFRHDRDFAALTEDAACEALELDLAKRAALVVMALVLKADGQRHHDEHEFFRKIRTRLGASAITVPVGMEAHMSLAIKYLGR